jgi:hypothetical protein
VLAQKSSNPKVDLNNGKGRGRKAGFSFVRLKLYDVADFFISADKSVADIVTLSKL